MIDDWHNVVSFTELAIVTVHRAVKHRSVRRHGRPHFINKCLSRLAQSIDYMLSCAELRQQVRCQRLSAIRCLATLWSRLRLHCDGVWRLWLVSHHSGALRPTLVSRSFLVRHLGRGLCHQLAPTLGSRCVQRSLHSRDHRQHSQAQRTRNEMVCELLTTLSLTYTSTSVIFFVLRGVPFIGLWAAWLSR